MPPKKNDNTTDDAADDKGAAADDKAADSVVDRTSPGYVLVPGDVGYAPPARLANNSGEVLTRAHLGYIEGADASLNMLGEVPLAMPPPAAETMMSIPAHVKPSTTTAAAASAQFGKLISHTTAYVLDNPHPLFGIQAVVSRFFRDLAGRQAALGTAEALGRTVEPDAVDKSKSKPPPEFFQLRHMAQQFVTAQSIYEGSLTTAGLKLSDANQATMKAITAEFEPLSKGPTSPTQVPTEVDPAPATVVVPIEGATPPA
jgi:hypothetical protein